MISGEAREARLLGPAGYAGVRIGIHLLSIVPPVAPGTRLAPLDAVILGAGLMLFVAAIIVRMAVTPSWY